MRPLPVHQSRPVEEKAALGAILRPASVCGSVDVYKMADAKTDSSRRF